VTAKPITRAVVAWRLEAVARRSLLVIGVGAARMAYEAANETPNETDVCRGCGACCAYSAEWPRFSLESEADLAQIPRAYVDDARGRMRCAGDRCAALVGDVGAATACVVYAARPQVCRDCLPGDDACRMARRRFNLEDLVATPCSPDDPRESEGISGNIDDGFVAGSVVTHQRSEQP
jgi:Fe-S-cluster containining protein